MAASSEVLDRIEVRGLEWLLFCGVLPHEKAQRQPFRLDVDLFADLAEAGVSDDLEHTVNYGAFIDRLDQVLMAEKFELLERVAQRVVEVGFEFVRVEAVTVSVHKLRPPVAAHASSTGVRIHRIRPAA